MLSYTNARLTTRGKEGSSHGDCRRKANRTSSSRCSSSGSSARDEGYSADWESMASRSSSTRPPEKLHFRNHHQHYRAHQQRLALISESISQENSNKRQKLSESVFAAHNARMDLETAEQSVPKLCADRPRAIPLACLDVSRVDFVYSSQLPADGFHSLIQATNELRQAKQDAVQSSLSSDSATTQETGRMQNGKDDSPYNILEDEKYIKDLLKVTATFYETSETASTSSETESSTSSMSDTESDCEAVASAIRRANISPPTVANVYPPVANPLDHSDAKSVASVTDSSFALRQPVMSCPPEEHYYEALSASVKIPTPKIVPNATLPPCSMTMGNALNVCQQGRLVINCLAPFQVVHANAAMARLNGCGCHDIIGQPLSRILVLTQKTGKLQGSFGEERQVAVRQLSKNAPLQNDIGATEETSTLWCTMKILPIVSGMTAFGEQSEQKCVTHLCIDLIASDQAAALVEHRRPIREDHSMAYVMG